nr:MAG TPA: hypothetical protein [Caudoviricetes sp.]
MLTNRQTDQPIVICPNKASKQSLPACCNKCFR